MPSGQPAPIRVLVADDESRIRLALRKFLEADGYAVAEASDGIEAMTQIIQWSPEVMILDLAMPNLDGIRTLGELEGVHGQLKPAIIVLTAWGSQPAAMRAIGLGASAFIEKPIDPPRLRAILSRVIEEREQEKSSSAGVKINWNVHPSAEQNPQKESTAEQNSAE